MALLPLLEDEEFHWLATLSLGTCVAITALDNALTNKVFLLEYADGQFYIFKRLNNVARSRQEREHELRVLQLAFRYQLSVNVIASCQQYRLQAYIYATHPGSDMSVSTTIALLAAQLSRIHQLPLISIGRQNLAGQLLDLHKKCNRSVDKRIVDRYLKLAQQLDSRCDCDTLCHGDLSLNNILLTDRHEVKIIDWEYSVLACPAYDVGSCAAINALTSDQEEKLIEAYFLLNKHHLSVSLVIFKRDCHAYRSLFTYLNALWKSCFVTDR